MKNTKAFIIITSVVVLACIVALIIVQQKYKRLRADLENEQVKSETISKEMQASQRTYEDKLNVLTNEKNEITEELEMKAKTLTTQTVANRRIKQALQAAELKIEEARQLNQQLENKLQSGDTTIASLNANAKTLQDSLISLADQNNQLEAALEEAILKSMDETLVTALKRNDRKITSKARAVRKLLATVELPGNYKNIHFNVVGPAGNELSNSGQLTSRMIPDSETLTASTDNQSLYPAAQTFQIVYEPEEKLEPGIYTIEAYNGDLYVGSMQVKLR